MAVLMIDNTFYWMNKTLIKYSGKLRLIIDYFYKDVANSANHSLFTTVAERIIREPWKKY